MGKSEAPPPDIFTGCVYAHFRWFVIILSKFSVSFCTNSEVYSVRTFPQRRVLYIIENLIYVKFLLCLGDKRQIG